MANILSNNFFRITRTTLNFVSPSIAADILLHPFDFATVLLQIGYNPEGIKHESATLVSVILQYALFTFYIPYLLTSIHGLQFMGMPHPGIFYYVNYVYNKEGFLGCYRGLMPKIYERLVMVIVNDRVRKRINKVEDPVETSSRSEGYESDQDTFVQTLLNSVCCQFFAVLASHPFHVIMVSSFAEFTQSRKSSFLELSHAIYENDGYFGFFTGLTARLLGELLSLLFSMIYTTIINKQLHIEQQVDEASAPEPETLVNYVTDASRFSASPETDGLEDVTEENQESRKENQPSQTSELFTIVKNFLGNFTQNDSSWIQHTQNRQADSLTAFIPFTSRFFYYIMIRDFISKKISNPFSMVCHCSIVLDTGWDKFPLLSYLPPMVDFVQVRIKTPRRNRVTNSRTTVW